MMAWAEVMARATASAMPSAPARSPSSGKPNERNVRAANRESSFPAKAIRTSPGATLRTGQRGASLPADLLNPGAAVEPDLRAAPAGHAA